MKSMSWSINAGAFSFRDILQNTRRADRKRILCLHALTTTLTCRLFGAEMSRRGCGGHILNMASYSLWMPGRDWRCTAPANPTCVVFGSFAKEVREQNIRVTAVCPAGVATDLYGLRPAGSASAAAGCAHHTGQLCPASLKASGEDAVAAYPAGGTGFSYPSAV